MSTTRGKTTPNSTAGSWSPHAGQKSRLLVPSDLGTCTKCDSPLTPINEADEFDTRAGEPGDTRCSDLTCPLSDTDQPAETSGDVRSLVDPMIAAQAPLPVRPKYVICVRDPDYSNEFHTFDHGDGDIVVLDIDLGATLENGDDDAYTDFVHNHLTAAATIGDPGARGKYLSILAGVLNDQERPDLTAAIDYMNDQPVRAVIASQSVLSFDPQAIRDHFDGDGTDISDWVVLAATDEDLARVADAALSNHRLYDAFHDVLTDAVNNTITITEQDQT